MFVYQEIVECEFFLSKNLWPTIYFIDYFAEENISLLCKQWNIFCTDVQEHDFLLQVYNIFFIIIIKKLKFKLNNDWICNRISDWICNQICDWICNRICDRICNRIHSDRVFRSLIYVVIQQFSSNDWWIIDKLRFVHWGIRTWVILWVNNDISLKRR